MCQASGHLDLPGCPVYFWGVLLQPRVPHYQVLFSKVGDGKQGGLCMVFVPQDEADCFSDGASFILGTINIVDWDWSRQGLGGQPVGLDIVSTDEHSSSS